MYLMPCSGLFYIQLFHTTPTPFLDMASSSSSAPTPPKMVTEAAAIAAMRAMAAMKDLTADACDVFLRRECEKMRQDLWTTNAKNAIALATTFIKRHAIAKESSITGAPGRKCYCAVHDQLEKGKRASYETNPLHNPALTVYNEYLALPRQVRSMVHTRFSGTCWCRTFHHECDCHPKGEYVTKKRTRFNDAFIPAWLRENTRREESLRKRLKVVVGAMATREIINKGIVTEDAEEGSDSDESSESDNN